MINIKQFTFLLILGITCLFNSNIYAQDSLYVKGQVIGSNNKPLSNIAISIEGVFTDPAITDAEGKFEMKSPSGDVWLLVSPVGYYKTKRIFLNNRSDLKIYLTPKDVASIHDDVTAVFGTEKRRSIIGAFESVSVDDVHKMPYETIDEYFQGRVAGMNVVNNSGTPGDGAIAYLRGITSMNANNQPLVIVDGMLYENSGIFQSILEGNIYNPLSTLDPLDITNISVLKDAEATAIYGTKGSNGVILIETLKPTETKTTIDVAVQGGVSLAPRKLPVLNSQEYRTYANEVLVSSGQKEEDFLNYYQGLANDPTSDDYYAYNNETDWQDQVFDNSKMSSVMFRVRGGDAIAKYGLSLGYLNHEGIIQQSDYSRYNLRFVGVFNIFEWLKLNISTGFNYNSSNLFETGLSAQTSPIMTSLFKSPMLATNQFDELGRELIYLDEPREFNVSNPAGAIARFEGTAENYRLVTTFKLNTKISDNLFINNLIGFNLNNKSEHIYAPNAGMVSYYDNEAINFAKHQVDNLFRLYNDNNLTFSKTYNSIHSLTALAGMRFYTNKFEEDYGVAKNLPENDQYTSLKNGESQLREIGGDNGEWNWLSLYSNVNYSFKDKYFVGASVSFDGSSRVGEDANTSFNLGGQPFGLFSSINGAWRIGNEGFLKENQWLEDAKLRASYGVTGNDDIGNYNSKKYYVVDKYRGVAGLYLGAQPNSELKYETVKQFNLGLDMAVLGDRFTMSFDYFRKKTEDMLIYERIEPFLGYDSQPTNGGNMENTGYELSAFGRIIDNNFKWDMTASMATYENEVISVAGGERITNIQGGQIITKKGEAVNSFYGYMAEGVFASTEEALAAGLINERGLSYTAGDVKYRDISGPNSTPDGIINEYDKTIIGNPNPELFGSISNRLTYKKWSLNVMMQFSLGNDVFNYLRSQTESLSSLNNQSTAVLNRWTYEGQVTEIPKASWEDAVGNTDFSSRWIEDGSYLRLKNISLSYTIPDEWLSFRNAQFYATANNIYTWTKYLGYDPEFSYSTSPLMQGVDYGLTPQRTTFVLGVKLGL